MWIRCEQVTESGETLCHAHFERVADVASDVCATQMAEAKPAPITIGRTRRRLDRAAVIVISVLVSLLTAATLLMSV